MRCWEPSGVITNEVPVPSGRLLRQGVPDVISNWDESIRVSKAGVFSETRRGEAPWQIYRRQIHQKINAWFARSRWLRASSPEKHSSYRYARESAIWPRSTASTVRGR